MILNRIDDKLFFDKIKEFSKIKYERNIFILENNKANCMSFISYIFPEFEELLINFISNQNYNDNRGYINKENNIHLEKIEEPENYSIVFLSTLLNLKEDDYFEHVGIYYNNKIYHFTKTGVQGVDLKTIKKIYKSMYFFDIIKIK